MLWLGEHQVAALSAVSLPNSAVVRLLGLPSAHRCLLSPHASLLQQRRWVGVYGPITLRRSNAVRWGASVLFFPHQGSRERREVSRSACQAAVQNTVLVAKPTEHTRQLFDAKLPSVPFPPTAAAAPAAQDGAPRHTGGGSTHPRPRSDCAAWPQGGSWVRCWDAGRFAAEARLESVPAPHPPFSFPYPRLALHYCLVVSQGAAASGLLNFGVEQYPGEQQRYGPDLHAFLLSLW